MAEPTQGAAGGAGGEGGTGGTGNQDGEGSAAAGATSLTGGDANKDGQGKQDGGKPADEGVKPPAVPEKYELKVPDGQLVDEGLMKEFTAIGKELGWTNDHAQKVADLHLKAIGMFARAQAEQHEAQLLTWHKEVNEDKEIGGAKLDATMNQARKVMTFLGTIPGVNLQRLTTDLNNSGLTTHPDLVRAFHFIGQFIGEDNKFIGGQPANTPKDAAEVLYGPDGVKKK